MASRQRKPHQHARNAGSLPSGQKSATISGSRSGDSHLFTAKTVSICDGHFLRKDAMSSSVLTMPVLPSTTTTTAHDSLNANDACSRISERNWSDSLSSNSRPPVSTTSKTRPHHSAL